MNWNSAGDGAPSHSGPVLVCFAHGQYLVATWDDGSWWSYETDERIEDVTAWAEIAPPNLLG